MILLSASSGGLSFGDFTPFVNVIIGTGFAGFVAVAFALDWIVSRGKHREVKDERDEWKALYLKEQESHQKTRDALTLASQRAEAGVEAAQVTKLLVDALREEHTRAPRV